MLSRKICKRCFIKTNKENNKTVPVFWLVKAFDRNWKEGAVRCPEAYNNDVNIYGEAGTGLLKRCPYVLEHMLQEQKPC
jgi:hypothetical protein